MDSPPKIITINMLDGTTFKFPPGTVYDISELLKNNLNLLDIKLYKSGSTYALKQNEYIPNKSVRFAIPYNPKFDESLFKICHGRNTKLSENKCIAKLITMINKGVDINIYENYTGDTPLIIVCTPSIIGYDYYFNKQIAILLIENGADVNAFNKRWRYTINSRQ